MPAEPAPFGGTSPNPDLDRRRCSGRAVQVPRCPIAVQAKGFIDGEQIDVLSSGEGRSEGQGQDQIQLRTAEVGIDDVADAPVAFSEHWLLLGSPPLPGVTGIPVNAVILDQPECIRGGVYSMKQELAAFMTS